MKKELKMHYGKRFSIEHVSVFSDWYEIQGFQFMLLENRDSTVFFYHKAKNLSFNQEVFEANYNAVKERNAVSEKLEHLVRDVFPLSKALVEKIQEKRDTSFRWINNLYTAVSLTKKEETLEKLDSLCLALSKDHPGLELRYNFYFPAKDDTIKSTDKRGVFFAYENFKNNYFMHYAVSLRYTTAGFIIVGRKLMDHIDRNTADQLKQAIKSHILTNKLDYNQKEISLLEDYSVDRDIRKKKFGYHNNSGKIVFGFINIETKEIDFVK